MNVTSRKKRINKNIAVLPAYAKEEAAQLIEPLQKAETLSEVPNIIHSFLIDCRSNPGQKGDLFSWRAVSELKDVLCPYPWRVPTVQDFIDLDIALGGTGESLSSRPLKNI